MKRSETYAFTATCPHLNALAQTIQRALSTPNGYRIDERSGQRLGGDPYMWEVGEVQKLFGAGKF